MNFNIKKVSVLDTQVDGNNGDSITGHNKYNLASY